MKKLSILSLLAINACVTTPDLKMDIPLPLPDRDAEITRLLAYPSNHYPVQGWDEDYTKIIKLTLEKFPVKKMPCDPIITIKGIVKAESDFNRMAKYHESFGVDSLGLLQLSVSDSPTYNCGFKDPSYVTSAIRNLYCGIRIMNKLETKYSNKNFYQAQGLYWSSLRKYQYWPGKNQSGWNRVKEYWKNNGCSAN